MRRRKGFSRVLGLQPCKYSYFTFKFLEFVDCGLLEILRLWVYRAIWWKVYLWGLVILIVLWKYSEVPGIFDYCLWICGVLCYLWSILSVVYFVHQ